MTKLEGFYNEDVLEQLLYDEEILSEYDDVLHRSKFDFSDDRVFYEVALSKDGAYMETGNLRHFPKTPFVVTPAQMIEIVGKND